MRSILDPFPEMPLVTFSHPRTLEAFSALTLGKAGRLHPPGVYLSVVSPASQPASFHGDPTDQEN